MTHLAPPPLARTFDQWSRVGFKVTKGSKSLSRNAQGVPLFTEDQVERYLDPLAGFDGPDLDGFSDEDDDSYPDPGVDRDGM